MKTISFLLVLNFCFVNLFAQQQKSEDIQLKNTSLQIQDTIKSISTQSAKSNHSVGTPWTYNMNQEVKKEFIRENIVTESSLPPLNKPSFQEFACQSKNPNWACVFSILVPGLGQIYNGEISKGLSFFVSTFGMGFLGLESISKSPSAGSINLAVALGLYAWNVIDAPRSAKQINQRNGIVEIHFKKSNLLVNPNVDCLHAQNGQEMPQTTNAGVKVTYAFVENK